MTVNVSNRVCGDCSKCCEGWVRAVIFDKPIQPGLKCHYLGTHCTIHEKRPQVCRDFFCAWVKDKTFSIPEWMKPNLSNVIIAEKTWGRNNEKIFWDVAECGVKMDSNVLNWILMHCSQNNISLRYHISGARYYHSIDPEFATFMDEHPF